jgi:hypothetical protein
MGPDQHKQIDKYEQILLSLQRMASHQIEIFSLK